MEKAEALGIFQGQTITRRLRGWVVHVIVCKRVTPEGRYSVCCQLLRKFPVFTSLIFERFQLRCFPVIKFPWSGCFLWDTPRLDRPKIKRLCYQQTMRCGVDGHLQRSNVPTHAPRALDRKQQTGYPPTFNCQPYRFRLFPLLQRKDPRCGC